MPSRELQALLDAAVDGIVMIDHQGHIEAFNRSAERLFGFTAQEMIGAEVERLMPEPYRSEHARYMERYAETGIPHIIGVGRHIEAVRKDGTVFPAFLSVGRVADADPPRFVGFIRDVTIERQAVATIQAERDRAEIRRKEEQEARRLQERMTHVSRLATLGEMAAGIAHEINQPLSAIATYARACERFLQAAEPDMPETMASLQEIGLEALRAGDIIRRLRQLVSSPTSARGPLSLNAVIRDLDVLAQADARVHKAILTLELAQDLPHIRAEHVQLQQLVLSLIRNALEAVGSVATSERTVIVKTQALPDRRVQLSVCDNGPGVAPEMQDRLFMPFATTKALGTGLGLAISQSIAQAHGGTIGHQPASPRGACFYVRLPSLED